ncbi:MAG: hypothetical protein LBV57_04495, partial [Candidatus Symbiothrix sp.]|nr:hypothetical protein [Candidatus Symbiothrix sp.]
MKKSVMLPLLLAGMILSMVSCLPEPGESYFNIPADPAVVRKIEDLTYISTPRGHFLAPDLSDKEDNACLIVDYTVYPDRNPLTAEAIQVLLSVKQSIAEKKESMVVDKDTLPFITITPVTYSEFLDGKIFFELTHSMTKDAEIAYQMTWVPTTNGSTDE